MSGRRAAIRCAGWCAAARIAVWAAAAIAQVNPPMSLVPTADAQPQGPTYSFRVGVFEVTNAQYAAFLNDTLLHPNDERGAYVFHDTDSATVLLAASPTGGMGTNGVGTLAFASGLGQAISFVPTDVTVTSNGSYVVAAGLEDHPVVGMTWYGAVKFCNWLTLDAGLGTSERAYAEGPLAGDWHPVTITSMLWAARDLNAVERDALVDRLGYRLLMDDQSAVATAHNEWLKAAAFIPGAQINRAYGFGRDVLTGADANYLGSGDPFDDGSSPVGWFDGVHTLSGGGPTSANANGYGLFDMSGNVWEWMQDQSFTPQFRGRRGGGWATSSINSLRVDQVTPSDAQEASSALGFRVVQAMRRAVQLTPATTINLSGPCGGPYTGNGAVLTVTSPTTAPLSYRITSDSGWLTIDGRASQSGSLPIGDTDSNGLVDDSDYAVLAACWSGPGAAPQPAPPVTVQQCLGGLDYDDDGDIDLRDARVLLRAAGAPAGARSVDHALTVGACSGLAVGLNTATVALEVDALSLAEQRTVNLTVSEPISVSPASDYVATGLAGGPFAPVDMLYRVDNASQTAMPVRAQADAGWVDLQWLDATDGTPLVLDTNGAVSIGPAGADLRVSINASDPVLVVGSHSAVVTVTNTVTGSVATRSVQVTIDAGLMITPPASELVQGQCPNAYAPASLVYTVTNPSAGDVTVTASVSPPGWFVASPMMTTVGSGASVPVTLTPGFLAAPVGLAPGSYQATVTFTDAVSTGVVETRAVGVTVIDWVSVSPASDLIVSGPEGGGFVPASASYAVSNQGIVPTDYSVVVDYDDPQGGWISLANGGVEHVCTSGVVCTDGTLPAIASFADTIAVKVNGSAAGLAAGAYRATLRFQSAFDTTGCSRVTRTVDLVVSSAPLLPNMVTVAGDDGGGSHPAYDFLIGRGEVTNAEYARFLNSALAQPSGAVGQYMFFDRDTGSVYINTSAVGQVGSNGFVGTGGFAALLLDAPTARYIRFDQSRYVVSNGFENYPVVGVTWYGAVKFCNATSAMLGLDAALAVYGEGPTVADWVPRFSRGQLAGGVTNALRLAMDDSGGGASPFNEWYKAAALVDTNGAVAVYGFGRDALTGADANYTGSGDPFESGAVGVSPVGFYDGTNALAGGGLTSATSNAYGLVDMTGNVAEWVHGDVLPGRVRGGSWRNVGASGALRCDTASLEVPGAARDYVGFRVAQTLTHDPMVLSPVADAAIVGIEGGGLTFVGGTFLDPGDLTYTLSVSTNGTPRNFSVAVDTNWLDVNSNSGQSGIVSAAGSIGFALSVSSNALGLVSPVGDAGTMWADVSIASQQPLGPTYSFRVGRFEVTNTEYAAFLTAAIADPGGPIGQYLFHDTDSGDVYLGTQQTGATGTNGSGVLMFRSADGGRIRYDVSSNAYVVAAGYGDHPVVGVSWFGAVKYCNYLTIADQLSAGDRAYTEGPYAGDWHPVVMSTTDWWGTTDTASNGQPVAGARDLNDTERWAWVTDVRGYRLVMDGGVDGAGAFSEWFEAAAWDPSAGMNTAYGFGRGDPIGQADANFGQQVGQVTTVGFYDGVHVTSSGVLTRDTANTNGLYDISGNVREWVEDRAAGTLGLMRVRGGSYADPAASIRADAPAVERAPGATDAVTGFRVARGGRDLVATVTFTDQLMNTTLVRRARLFLEPALTWTPATGFASQGDWPGPYVPAGFATVVSNRSAGSVDVGVAVDASWVTLDVTTASIAPAGALVVTASINASAAGPAPGVQAATLTLTNERTGTVRTRSMVLTIDEPLGVSPAGDLETTGWWGASVVGPVGTYILSNGIAQTVDYQVTADAAWVDVGKVAAGSLAPGGTVSLPISLNAQADQLPGPANYVATITVDNLSAGSAITRHVNLSLLDPLEVIDTNGLVMTGNFGGPFAPSGGTTYTLTNRADIPVDWSATADASWLDINGGASAGGSLGPGVSIALTVDVNTTAELLTDGTYTATVGFADLTTPLASVQSRAVTLTVNEFLVVTPISDAEVIGPVGGSFAPLRAVYTVTNRDNAAMTWQADVSTGGLLTVNGQWVTGGMLAADESATVVVDVDAVQTAQLPAGTSVAAIRFRNLSSGAGDAVRNVRIEAVTPINSVGLATVDPSPRQPGGPAYAFSVSRFEITNGEFARFLNDALTHPTTERGMLMYHDTDSGDVYINATTTGFVGTAGVGTYLFRAATGGAIGFDVASNAYRVTAGLDDRPVVGVSWYGAVKYCNWLTLDAGLPPSSRCYSESDAANLDGWRPITISQTDWASRDLNDTERAQLVALCGGYRLPMDDGMNNPDPATDQADAYNEWYQAAAWRVVSTGGFVCSNGLVGSTGFDCTTGGVGDTGYICSAGVLGSNGAIGCNTVFGFGRDQADGRDANYAASGDPFDDAVTPVGFFDGVNTQADGVTPTRANRNSYGLFDLSGNVQEWVQDKYATPVDRAVRGGAFISTPAQNPWINNDGRRKSGPQVATSSLIGFRVVRVVSSGATPGDADGDGDVDLVDYAVMSACVTGPASQLLGLGCDVFDFDADANVDLEDIAAFTRLLPGN